MLKSDRAVAMSVAVVRAFVRLRRFILSSRALARKLAELERAVKSRLDKHDDKIKELFEAIEDLLDKDGGPGAKKRIGFI